MAREHVKANPAEVPAGLEIHCAGCGLVVPSDAPKLAVGADCMHIARNKLAWFNPRETPAGQHAMAVCCWVMIHDAVLRSDSKHGGAEAEAAREFHRGYRESRREHFSASAVRAAMTEEQVAEHAQHLRDGALY